MKGKQTMKKTVFEHLKEVVETAAGKDFKNRFGFNLSEVKRSRKISSGWHMQLNRTYTAGKTTVFNMFTKEYIECPVWFSKIYEEMLYAHLLMKDKINPETMALFEFFKIACYIEDNAAFKGLIDFKFSFPKAN